VVQRVLRASDAHRIHCPVPGAGVKRADAGSGGPVRSQVLGKETIDKAQQAARVQDFMNYQITTVMEEYTPEFDQALFLPWLWWFDL
jgi:hypothetical protein